MKSIFHIAAIVAAVSVFAVSCMKDPMLDDMSRSGEDGSIAMDVGFTAFGTALDTRATGGTSGNAIGEVRTLQVLFYSNAGADKSEGSAELKYIFMGTPTDGGEGIGKADDKATDGVHTGEFTFTRKDAERTDADSPTPGAISGNTTQHMTFRLDNVERGNYRIYVVANMPASFNAATDAGTVKDLREYKLTWNPTEIAANNAMFGFFTKNSEKQIDVIQEQAPLIGISGPQTLHAWIKRAVSKVTVAFDGTRLDENVWIYIKSAQIRDIPNSCLLGAKNTPQDKKELISGEDNDKGETPSTPLKSSNAIVVYNSQAGAVGEAISTGNPRFPRPNSGESPEQWKARIHSSESENSLFFFENMQGEGKGDLRDEDGTYKPQTDRDLNGIPDDANPDREFEIKKDGHSLGTYIEVKAYYVNNGNYEVSRGDITYRFMLGKDIYTSFDAERSIHYKVTLQFNNNANDVDWHIDIQEDPDIYVPEIYYVSYNYNETTMLPVRIVGRMEGRLKAEIIENSWGGPAAEAGDLNQYLGSLFLENGDPYELTSNTQGQITNGLCNGFLQLRKLKAGEEFEIGKGVKSYADLSSAPLENPLFNEAYWYTNGNVVPETAVNNRNAYRYDYNLGVREYSPDGKFECGDIDNQGVYTTEMKAGTTSENGTTSFNIPLYTRQMKIVSTSGYSGANPYYSIEGTREAKIRFTATVNGEKVQKTVTILQRPRIENPTGIWRAWNNSAPFDVTLQYRQNENETDALAFLPVESYGPWEAEVSFGSDFITLETSGIGRKDGDKIKGNTDTHIKFRVNFNGTCPDATTVRCGIITITYHNNSCTHRIFVRQGYAPLALLSGGAKWHSFNLYTNGQETDSPCEEGSLFRADNLTLPISETNNRRAKFNDSNVGSLQLAPSGSATWRDITYKDLSEFTNGEKTFSDSDRIMVSGKAGYTDGRIPTWEDFGPLVTGEDIQVAFGVLYADGASKENDGIGAFHYSRDGRSENGMRGCFVYNVKTGNNIFLPVGYSGYGRRQENGILRYANTAGDLSKAGYRPLLWKISTNEGAIYWSGKKELTDDLTAMGLQGNSAFDINYKTFDFNGFGTNQEIYDAAAYIRLVSDR